MRAKDHSTKNYEELISASTQNWCLDAKLPQIKNYFIHKSSAKIGHIVANFLNNLELWNKSIDFIFFLNKQKLFPLQKSL